MDFRAALDMKNKRISYLVGGWLVGWMVSLLPSENLDWTNNGL
jgi:hypothetical protein